MTDIDLKTDEEELLGLFRRMESPSCRLDLLFQAETMVRAQESLKTDLGLSDRRGHPGRRGGRKAEKERELTGASAAGEK